MYLFIFSLEIHVISSLSNSLPLSIKAQTHVDRSFATPIKFSEANVLGTAVLLQAMSFIFHLSNHIILYCIIVYYVISYYIILYYIILYYSIL